MGEIRLHGRGGQGTVIAAEMLANAFVHGGVYASVFPSFGVERRGSIVTAFARFGDSPIREHTKVYRPDILFMLDQSLVDRANQYEGFRRGGLIIANTRHEDAIVKLGVAPKMIATVDATSIALEETGIAVTNTCMLGAFARATGLVRLEDLESALALYLSGDVLARNLRSMKRGFEEVKVSYFEVGETTEDPVEQKIVDTTIKLPQFTSSFDAAWADVDKKILTVQTGDWRSRQPTLDKAACRLCGWCSIYCPAGCIKLGEDGYYQADLNYCKGCGVCVNECPAHARKLKDEEAI